MYIRYFENISSSDILKKHICNYIIVQKLEFKIRPVVLMLTSGAIIIIFSSYYEETLVNSRVFLGGRCV